MHIYMYHIFVLSESLNKTFPFVVSYVLVCGMYERFIKKFSFFILSRSNQCSTTGVTKAVVCVILYVG